MKTQTGILFIALQFIAITTTAQLSFDATSPVTTSVTKKAVSGHDDLVEIVVSFSISEGWHVYGPDNDGGPTALTFNAEILEGAVVDGKPIIKPAPQRVLDPVFGCEVTYFEQQGTITQRLRLTGGEWHIQGYVEYGACNDQMCMPPTPVEFNFSGKAAQPQVTTTQPPVQNYTSATDADSTDQQVEHPLEVASTAEADTMSTVLFTPVSLTAEQTGESSDSQSLLGIFLLGLLGGILALVTPCVWPIIPMTVSFFLKRARDNRRQGLKDATLYGLSIIVIYVGLGLLVTLIWGPSQLNAISTNAVFNLFLFALLVVFAASFLGGFEITLPSSWSTKLDNKATSTTGLLSIFLMAATLVIVSFSCTGPIIGFLLVDMVTSTTIIAPTIGMLGFALALAAPFTLFALFPSWLRSAPRSGSWMNVVKVVLGLLELAFALKFLSVADLAYGWRILDRETFLCLWILIFSLMGCYLLRWIRLPHDDDEYDEMGNIILRPRIGVIRFLLALCSLAFALYMIPGLWGAPCRAVSAFAPPMWTQDFRLGDNAVEAVYTDYAQGMAAARRDGKPVMLDFTGYGCVNCRKMEVAVWTDPRVRKLMTEDYVLVSLYVDDKTVLPETITTTEADGSTRRLRTIGDKWSYLQRSRFGAQTQPFYVLLDNDGQPLTSAYSYDENIDRYIEWLERGLTTFRNK